MTDIPTILVIFGVTGDLMRKKIAPALLGLYQEGCLPRHTKIIGFARRPLGDNGFRQHLVDILGPADDKFLSLFSYNQGQFGEADGYASLKQQIGLIEQEWGVCANKLLYLAVPPENFNDILARLGQVGLNFPCSDSAGWSRLLIEKPFGHDEASAKILDNNLAQYFSEEQIYRLDHYLAKDGVMALERIAEPERVKKITITLWEKMTADGRGAFYDSVGALRDMGQNHLLSIFTILTGELGNKLELVSSERKQYAGYQETAGVKSNSQTETYFKVVAKLDTDKWKNVEIILEAGKAMPEIKKEVKVEFTDGSEKIYPLELGRGSQYVAEYEQLFKDAIVGDKTRFLKRKEVEAAWQFVDKVIAAWQSLPLLIY